MASPVKKEGRKTTLQFLLLLLLRLGISSKPEQQLKDLDSWFFFHFLPPNRCECALEKGEDEEEEKWDNRSFTHFPFLLIWVSQDPVSRLLRGEGNSLSFDAGGRWWGQVSIFLSDEKGDPKFNNFTFPPKKVREILKGKLAKSFSTPPQIFPFLSFFLANLNGQSDDDDDSTFSPHTWHHRNSNNFEKTGEKLVNSCFPKKGRKKR